MQFKEDLRDVAWREKLWSIYTTNPNNYKIRRFESKRVQQIDRKLRQYYAFEKQEESNKPSSQKENHYRTFDPSQLDTRSSFKSASDRHATQSPLLLLKDLSKFEYQHSVSVPGGAAHAPSNVVASSSSSAPNTSPTLLHPSYVSQNNSQARKPTHHSNDITKPVNKFFTPPTAADLGSIPLDAPPGAKPSRFTVEKIRNEMV